MVAKRRKAAVAEAGERVRAVCTTHRYEGAFGTMAEASAEAQQHKASTPGPHQIFFEAEQAAGGLRSANVSPPGTRLRIGGSEITLRKSDELVGVRPGRGRAEEAAAAAGAHRARIGRQRLGGFRLTTVAEPGEAMEAALNALRADPSVEQGTHVYHTSNDRVPFVPTGDVYVEFKPATSAAQRQRILDELALRVVDVVDKDAVTVRVTASSPNPVKVAAALQRNAGIAVAEPDLATPGRLAGFVLPSDTLRHRQWHLENMGAIDGSALGLKRGADARVVAAWKRAGTLGASEVVLAVIDDGFDLDHPDLSGPGKIVAPWDFTRNSADPRPEHHDDYPYYQPGYGSWSGDWHGTACAGVAIGNAQGTGILGAAPACRLMPVRWGPNLSNSQVVAWFNYVREQGAAVVSCSWGAQAAVFPLSTPVRNAITRCAREGRAGKGAVICFAAGNEDRDIDAPDGTSHNGFATHPEVLAVAACTSRDQRSDYSNHGAAIAVCAPSSGAGGRAIVTSDVMGTFTRDGRVIDSGYGAGEFTDDFGGTSSATPLVAGICALLLSIDPNLTASQVRTIVKETARRIGPKASYAANRHSREFGFGCVNAEAAVARVVGAGGDGRNGAGVKRRRRRR